MTHSPESTPQPRSLAAMLARAPWRLIGVVLLIIVLANVDLRLVARQLAMIGPGALAAAALAFAGLLVFRCWRWRVLTEAIGAHEPLLRNLASCNRSIWLGLATPGRVGEFRRAGDLAAIRGWGLAGASSVVLADLLLDLAAYGAFALAAAFLVFAPPLAGAAGAVIVLLLFAACVLNAGKLLAAAMRAFPRLCRLPGLSQSGPALRDGFRGTVAAKCLVAAVGAALSYVLMIACLAPPLSIDFTLAHAGLAVGLAVAAGSVPISYFGLGTRDVTLIWFFGLLGVGQAEALAVSFMFLLAQLIGLACSLSFAIVLNAFQGAASVSGLDG